MIASSINHITKYLNQSCRNSFDLNEDIAVVSNLVEQDGSVPANIDNKLVVSLVNVEKDTIPNKGNPNHHQNDGFGKIKYPPIYLNLFLMVSAHFTGKNYSEALKFLSFAVSFFQKNYVFNHKTTPDLDPSIERLILDIENLDIKDLSSLWSVVSGKYIPSVLYKMRMITYDSDEFKYRVPDLKEIAYTFNTEKGK